MTIKLSFSEHVLTLSPVHLWGSAVTPPSWGSFSFPCSAGGSEKLPPNAVKNYCNTLYHSYKSSKCWVSFTSEGFSLAWMFTEFFSLLGVGMKANIIKAKPLLISWTLIKSGSMQPSLMLNISIYPHQRVANWLRHRARQYIFGDLWVTRSLSQPLNSATVAWKQL